MKILGEGAAVGDHLCSWMPFKNVYECLPIYMSTMCVPVAHKGQDRLLMVGATVWVLRTTPRSRSSAKATQCS